jgi:hypothetical protein
MTLERMIENTSNTHQKIRRPMDAIKRVTKGEGLSFGRYLADEKTRKDVLSLWDIPFGWTQDQVINLADRLAAKEHSSDLPNVWFSALEVEDTTSSNGKTVVGAAMAEKISFKGKDGRDIDIVELTEWSVGEDYRGNGYMAATIAQLTSQILHDYWSRDQETPFIIAECNIQAGAYKSGFSAGLRVPERTIFEGKASQILQQNVTVGDGIAPAGLRDFAFMYLPPAILDAYYTEEEVSLVA